MNSVDMWNSRARHQLGGLGRRDPHDLLAHEAVELGGALGAGGGDPAEDFGGVGEGVVGAAGVDPLGGERDVQPVADL